MDFGSTSNGRGPNPVAEDGGANARPTGSVDVEVEASEPAQDGFACPVCGAHQALSKACRRCKADLSLVVDVYAELSAKRARCLALIRQRRLLSATRLAKECVRLSGDESNVRLLATCSLLQSDFAQALRIRK